MLPPSITANIPNMASRAGGGNKSGFVGGDEVEIIRAFARGGREVECVGGGGRYVVGAGPVAGQAVFVPKADFGQATGGV